MGSASDSIEIGFSVDEISKELVDEISVVDETSFGISGIICSEVMGSTT